MSGPHLTTQRVFAIGLDMGDGELIRYWSHQGQLPHFASLLASGTWVDLESTAQVLHTSTWPTFATGTLPGRHGVYFPYQPKAGSPTGAAYSAGSVRRANVLENG